MKTIDEHLLDKLRKGKINLSLILSTSYQPNFAKLDKYNNHHIPVTNNLIINNHATKLTNSEIKIVLNIIKNLIITEGSILEPEETLKIWINKAEDKYVIIKLESTMEYEVTNWATITNVNIKFRLSNSKNLSIYR